MTGNVLQARSYAALVGYLTVVMLVACATPDATSPSAAADRVLRDTIPDSFTGSLVGGLATQIKAPMQVENEYLIPHKGLPERASVVTYTTTITPKSVPKGQTLLVVSDLTVVPGKDRKPTEIKEGIVLFDADGVVKQRAIKRVNSDGTAGEFRTEFVISFPQSASKGKYSFKTYLYLNAELVQSSSGTFELI